MLGTTLRQLRYGAAVLANRPIRPADLDRIAEELLATLAEFGEPGVDSALLPGQSGGVDPEVRRAVTARGLRATARAAAGRTAYYRRLFADLRLDPAALTPETWSQLPVTPKRALCETPTAFTADGVRPALMALTTGTSGTPTAVWFSRAELEIMGALSTIAAALALGLRAHHTVAYAGCSRATLPLRNALESVTRVGAAFVQLGTVAPAVALERLAAPLGLRGKEPRITHLTASASYLAALVGEAERAGRTAGDFGLERINVGGEVLSAALRERAAKVFGAEVGSGYLMTEIAPSGAQPCSHGHLHHTAEFGHLEVLDPESSEPAEPGGVGMLVHTPYVPYRECTLLLRYASGDLVRLPDGPLACELAHLPATSDVLGRWSGPLSARLTTRDLLELLEAEPAVPLPARYAVLPEPDGPVLHVLVERAPDGPLLGRLEERAMAAGLPLAGIVLHDDPARMPETGPLRADLLEHTFETAAGR